MGMPAIVLGSRIEPNEINGIFRMPLWQIAFADAAAVFIASDLPN
jgi:hypothetical protein